MLPKCARSLALVSLLGGALGASVPAHAHAPAKVLQYLSLAPDDIMLVTNRGLIFGDLQSRDFKLLCNEAYDVSPSEDAVRFVRLPRGRMLVASSNGLYYSDDRGCSWRPNAALEGLSVPSLVQHPTEPDTLFVSTYASDEPFMGTLRISRDGGETFQTLYDPGNEYFRTVQIADEGERLYATGQVLSTMPQHYVARSDDGGATWERSVVPLESDELYVWLLAVNPVQSDELLAVGSNREPALGERLLWSRDGGRTFSSLGKIPVISHATFAPDGSVAYVGSVAGLQRISGSSEARTLEPVGSTARITQVALRDGEIYASGYFQGLDAGLDGVGVSEGGELAFDRWMSFYEVDEQVECSAAVTSACRALWLDWQNENPSPAAIADAGVIIGGKDAGVARDAGSGAPRDAATREEDAAGADDGDADAAAPEPDPSHDDEGGDDGGCSASQGPRGLATTLALLGLFAWRRRWRLAPRRGPVAPRS